MPEKKNTKPRKGSDLFIVDNSDDRWKVEDYLREWTGIANNYICYAWKAVSGVSAFGTYTGGTSISETTNFEPKLIIIKNITNTEHWIMLDAFRGFKSSSLANPPALFPSAPDGEVLGSSGNYYHITTNSTGFTIGDSSNVVNGLNDGSSSTKYIYMAFA